MIQPRLKRLLFTGTAFFLSSMWLIFRPATAATSTDILLHAILSIVLAALLLLKSPHLKVPVESARVPITCAMIGLLLFVLGKIFSVNQIQWLGIVLMSFACLATGIRNRSTADLAKVAFLLYWANPLPSGIFLPLQLFMQKASVTGAELVLQSLNVRIWADGLLLESGMRAYEIPAWCSGMRTATAVLILSLGIGLHRRFAPLKLLLFTLLALLQALLLNIIRISLVVFLAPFTDDPSGFQLLHDSSGIVLIAAIFIIVVEMQLWSRRKQRQQDTDPEEQRVYRRAFSGVPAIVHIIRDHHRWTLITILIAGLSGIFLFRTRDYHRSEMIKGVAESLRDNGKMDSAMRAADEAFRHMRFLHGAAACEQQRRS
jgi:exosortase/archaeosortase family protein